MSHVGKPRGRFRRVAGRPFRASWRGIKRAVDYIDPLEPLVRLLIWLGRGVGKAIGGLADGW